MRLTDSSIGALATDGQFDLRIGTSRYGRPVESEWSRLTESVGTANSVLVAFGSPKNGLRELLQQQGKTPEDVFNYFVNTVPNQNVSTVRTEEAVLISLGILNLAFTAMH